MSFWGSRERTTFGVGVSKLLEDKGEDWWRKHLVRYANATKMDTIATGGAVVDQVNKYINPKIAEKWGFTFKGKINRSYAEEQLIIDAITDPCFVKVEDYFVGYHISFQVLKYMYDTYGKPTFGLVGINKETPSWFVDGNWVYAGKASLGFIGEYPDTKISTITISMLRSDTDEFVKKATIDYSKKPIAMIIYQTNCGDTVSYPLVDNAGRLLVDDDDNILVWKDDSTISLGTAFVYADEIMIEKYIESPFFMLDYKRHGCRNKSKYVFVMNTRLGLGNKPEPCSSPFGKGMLGIVMSDKFGSNYGKGKGCDPKPDWSTTVRGEAPEDMFTVNPFVHGSPLTCAESKQIGRDKEGCENGIKTDSDGNYDFSGGDNMDEDTGGLIRFSGSLCGNPYGSDGDTSTLDGVIDEEDNKTVFFTYASRYTTDENHPQYKYKKIIDEMLDVDGKYKTGFKPAHVSGKKAKSNYTGKGLGGYIIKMHDVEIAYVDYFVIAEDPNDYGTVDTIASGIGLGEEVPDQCETRDEMTGYSFVIDTYPLRMYDLNSDGECAYRNDNKVQYIIPYDWISKRTMPDRYRDVKELSCLMLQATSVRKLKWYETSGFRLLMFIVTFALNWFTFGFWTAALLAVLSVALSVLNVNPYIKLAVQVLLSVLTGNFAQLISTSNLISIAADLASIAISEYAKDEMTRMFEEGREIDKQRKATLKTLNKMRREALYSPLDEIDGLYDLQYDLLYNVYDQVTSTEQMTELDTKGAG